jgi:hypothetical protein
MGGLARQAAAFQYVREESACCSLKTGAGTILAASYIDHVRSFGSGRTKLQARRRRRDEEGGCQFPFLASGNLCPRDFLPFRLGWQKEHFAGREVDDGPFNERSQATNLIKYRKGGYMVSSKVNFDCAKTAAAVMRPHLLNKPDAWDGDGRRANGRVMGVARPMENAPGLFKCCAKQESSAPVAKDRRQAPSSLTTAPSRSSALVRAVRIGCHGALLG